MEKRLSKEERKNRRNLELCKLIKENDLAAETRLLMENEGLVVQAGITIKRKRKVNSTDGIDEQDLMQEGRLALLRAAKTFDETRSIKFSTYAFGVMKNAMKDLCDKHQSTFERHMESKGLTHLFLNDESSENVEYCPNGDIGSKDPTGNLAVLHVMLEKMRNRLEILPERERRVLMYHFGIGAIKANTISETAAYFHLSERYMRLIEKNGLAKMREMMNDGKII